MAEVVQWSTNYHRFLNLHTLHISTFTWNYRFGIIKQSFSLQNLQKMSLILFSQHRILIITYLSASLGPSIRKVFVMVVYGYAKWYLMILISIYFMINFSCFINIGVRKTDNRLSQLMCMNCLVHSSGRTWVFWSEIDVYRGSRHL